MEGTVYQGAGIQKIAHGKFLEWFNSLIEHYISSFYDVAMLNLIYTAFMKRHNLFIQELYMDNGKTLVGFISVVPIDTENYLFMVHEIGSGIPILYNIDFNKNLLEFDNTGTLVRFFENINLPLGSAQGNTPMECYIVFEDWYGIKCPMMIVKNKDTNAEFGRGYMDLPFAGKYRGTYSAVVTPMNELEFFSVKNISKVKIELEVPILKSFNLRFKISPDTAIMVPVTEFTEIYFKNALDKDNIELRRIKTPQDYYGLEQFNGYVDSGYWAYGYVKDNE